MLGESHDLYHEFPEYRERIQSLHRDDADFAALMADYNRLDEEIRDLEEHEQPVADRYMEDLKKERVLLKDRLFAMLTR